jgi:hypothetical protein
MSPPVANALQLLDPVSRLSRERLDPGQLTPVLIKHAQDGRQVKPRERLDSFFLNESLLLKGQTVDDIVNPPC